MDCECAVACERLNSGLVERAGARNVLQVPSRVNARRGHCRLHEICPGFVAGDLSGFHRRDRMLAEVRMTRVIDAIGLHRKKKLSCEEAGALLGMSERHFRRLRDAYEADGPEGITDRRRGRASGRRAGMDEISL